MLREIKPCLVVDEISGKLEKSPAFSSGTSGLFYLDY
jgi:hypothetical protein